MNCLSFFCNIRAEEAKKPNAFDIVDSDVVALLNDESAVVSPAEGQHLEHLHQPKRLFEDDEISLAEGELFDAPRRRSSKPFLEAAFQAKKQQMVARELNVEEEEEQKLMIASRVNDFWANKIEETPELQEQIYEDAFPRPHPEPIALPAEFFQELERLDKENAWEAKRHAKKQKNGKKKSRRNNANKKPLGGPLQSQKVNKRARRAPLQSRSANRPALHLVN